MATEDEIGGTGTGTSTGPGTVPGAFTGRGTDAVDAKGTEVELFDHEKLDVYRISREFVVLVGDWLLRKMSRDLHDQLERATTSILSNIGEGAGKTARADKRRFYETARGSSMEAATQIDLLRIRGVIRDAEYAQGRRLLIRIVKMLSRLCAGPRTT